MPHSTQIVHKIYVMVYHHIARNMYSSSYASDVGMTSTYYYRATFLLLLVVRPDQPIKGPLLRENKKRAPRRFRPRDSKRQPVSSFVECSRHTSGAAVLPAVGSRKITTHPFIFYSSHWIHCWHSHLLPL